MIVLGIVQRPARMCGGLRAADERFRVLDVCGSPLRRVPKDRRNASITPDHGASITARRAVKLGSRERRYFGGCEATVANRVLGLSVARSFMDVLTTRVPVLNPMRQGQQKRIRGRSRGGGNGGSGSGGGGGKGPNPLTRSYESNGPDVKIRGTAGTIADKYVQLSRDALSAGDPVAAENYMQHAEHYYRMLAAAQAQYQPNQVVVRADADDFNDPDEDDDGPEAAAEPNGQPSMANGGQPQGGQGYNAGNQSRSQNAHNGRPNGSYNQGPRDDNRRYDRNDRNDRRPEQRYDRQDGSRQDEGRQDGTRQDGARQDGARQDNGRQDPIRHDSPRQDGLRHDSLRPDNSRPDANRQDARPSGERHDNRRFDRDDRAPRVSGLEEQPVIGELPSFITGGVTPASPVPAPPAVTSEPSAPEPLLKAEPRARAERRPKREPAQPTQEPAAPDQPSEPALAHFADAGVDGDPRDDGSTPARGRRRRYGRFGRGPATEEGDQPPLTAPETTSD